MGKQRSPWYLQHGLVIAALAGLSTIFAVISYWLYERSAQQTFERAVADQLLQLALIVIAGALITALLAVHGEKRKRYDEDAAARHEFLRRLRTANLQVQVARRLIAAHDSARTYSEQLRALIATRAELEDIGEDLRVRADLFAAQQSIETDIKRLVDYLLKGEEEWNEKKRPVDQAWERDHQVTKIFQELKMHWVISLVDRGDGYKGDYERPVLHAKGLMRNQVYRARQRKRDPAPAADPL